MISPSAEQIAEKVNALGAALANAYRGSAETGSFLRGRSTEWVPSVFLTLRQLRDLLASQARALGEAQRERDELQTARNDLWTHWNTRDLACREAEARAEQAEAERARLREIAKHAGALVAAWKVKDDIISAETFYAVMGKLRAAIEASTLATPVRPSEEPRRSCCAPAPDRSGRSCDKPAGHDGEHWTYGGNTLTWSSEDPQG